MTRYLFCGVILSLLSSGASGAELNLEEIIAKNTDAMGGRAAIGAVHAVEIDLHITDPKFEVDGIYRAARPDGCGLTSSRMASAFTWNVLTARKRASKGNERRKGSELTIDTVRLSGPLEDQLMSDKIDM